MTTQPDALTVTDTTNPRRYRYHCNLCGDDFRMNVGKHLVHQHHYSPTAALTAVSWAITVRKATTGSSAGMTA